MMSQRSRVIEVYKKLQYMGREYPGGPEKFRQRCHGAFARNAGEKDPQKIEELIKRGEFVIEELKALYSLRKYRAMKRRYYEEK
uniref:Complex 1 LYR protein domain-containing protein n=1 Tax=Nyssomyia neivai TaxID=330878 RepID=A0A1L8DCS7_9DIPT